MLSLTTAQSAKNLNSSWRLNSQYRANHFTKINSNLNHLNLSHIPESSFFIYIYPQSPYKYPDKIENFPLKHLLRIPYFFPYLLHANHPPVILSQISRVTLFPGSIKLSGCRFPFHVTEQGGLWRIPLITHFPLLNPSIISFVSLTTKNGRKLYTYKCDV